MDLAVRNNRFVDLPEGATAISTFNLPGTSNTYEITIENNEIAGVAGSASGIFLQNPVDSVITDNRIDAQSADADTRGIQLSGASGVVISDNVISNAGAKGIQVAGSPDPARAIVIRDNRLVNNGNGAASGPDEGGIAIYPDVGNLSVVANTFRGNDIAFAVRDKNREAAYANGGVVLRKNDFGGDNANANGYVVKDFKGAGTLDATLNWWGDPGAAGANVAGGVVYDPFLTAPPGQVARDPAELQQFGHDLTLPRDGDTYAVAFPGDLDTTVREVFSDLEEGEQVWAYNATDDEWLSGPEIADREVGALDAFLVSTKDKDSTDPVRIVFDYADASSPQAPTTKSVSAGWNLVGAAQYGSVDDAFDATVGVDRVAAVYAQAGSQPGGDGAPAPFVADSADSTRVSPFVGYWVFVDGDGEMAANIYPGVTADEERAALAY
ncbi:MAG: right-handed parallel beta-helix repeat-containing protein [Halobacteriaceae archaeon]